MIAYQIENSVITNVIVLADDADPADVGAVNGAGIPDGSGIGWRLVAGEWVPPDAPQISREVRIAARTAKRDEDLKSLSAAFQEAQFIDGANGESRIAELRAQRAAVMDAYAEDILTIMME